MSAAGRRPTAVMIVSRTSGRWLNTRIFSGELMMGVLRRRDEIDQVGDYERCYPSPPNAKSGARSGVGRGARLAVGPDQSSMAGAGNNARVTTAAPSISQRVHSLNRPNMVSGGTIVWLSSELMFFAGLFALFFTFKAQNDTGHCPPPPNHLDVPYALVVTIVLVASSFTCQVGVFAAERGDVVGLRRWDLVTLVMGAFFVLGQANEYRNLIEEGTTIPSSAYGTVFYLATGFHGLHVIGGLVAFIFVLGRTFVARKFTHEQAVTAIVVSYYWHFVDVVWIGLFATVYLIK